MTLADPINSQSLLDRVRMRRSCVGALLICPLEENGFLLSIFLLHCLSICFLFYGPPRMSYRVSRNILFLWGCSDFGRRFHWVSWRRICFPLDEGGLGIRNIRDIVSACQMKICWRVITSSSLWARYMAAKYLRHPNLYLCNPSGRHSQVLSRMIEVRSLFYKKILWHVRTGDVSFWTEPWSNLGILCSHLTSAQWQQVSSKYAKLKNSFSELEGWCIDDIRLLPDQVQGELHRMRIPYGTGSDLLLWKPDASGNFTIRSAWESIRQERDKDAVLQKLWHGAIHQCQNQTSTLHPEKMTY